MENGPFPENELSPGERRELLARWNRPAPGASTSFTRNDWTSARDIAQFDHEVAAIIQDVSVSPLLEKRVLARLEKVEREKRRRLAPKRWAVAISSIAAGILCIAMMEPFGKPSLDVNAVGSKIAGIHHLLSGNEVRLVAGQGSSDWPDAINSRTCVGHQRVELFGHRVTAYQLSAGNDQAVMVVMPLDDFPFELGANYIRTSYSSRRIDVHYLVAGSQVCILVTREGTNISSFKAAASVA